MSDVIKLEDYRPHEAQYVVCMSCGYDWVAVFPVGVTKLECSDCGALAGETINYHDRDWFNRFMDTSSKEEQKRKTLVLLNAKRMGL